MPTCTDADLVLGYLDPDFFAGGKIKLDPEASRTAIEKQVAKRLSLSTEDAAAGMYRVINTNMAQGVREVTIKRGYDPREFPMVVAGGAGPIHACMIAQELEIPMFIVPRESSIFCAAGMLMSDLQHDFVQSFVSLLDEMDWAGLNDLVARMMRQGERLLAEERIAKERMKFFLGLDCRYSKQYHEVSFPASVDAIRKAEVEAIKKSFHAEHNRMYGYSLEEQGTPVELINLRLRAVGITEKPPHNEESRAGEDPKKTLKGQRPVYIPEKRAFETVPVYDGHQTRHGHRIAGPALVEQVNTTLFLSSSFDCICDKYGSFAVYGKGREELVASTLPRETT